jgi:hypothetical protein
VGNTAAAAAVLSGNSMAQNNITSSPQFSNNRKKASPTEDSVASINWQFSVIFSSPTSTATLGSSGNSNIKSKQTLLSLDLMALNREDFINWTDGLQLLIVPNAVVPNQKSTASLSIMETVSSHLQENNAITTQLKEEVTYLAGLQLRISLLPLESMLFTQQQKQPQQQKQSSEFLPLHPPKVPSLPDNYNFCT